MLFNSYIFLFGFLPLTLLVFHLLGTRHPLLAKAWLAVASLGFYAWWNPIYVTVIIGALLVNYAIGAALIARRTSRPKVLLTAGIVGNLSLLGWFKYSAFVVNNVAALTGTSFHLHALALPLAISFFTFQKIAFLVDAYQGRIERCAFLDYCLFVTFFPQLIAGPIVHYREVAPQFAPRATFRLQWENLAIGFTLFAFGLFKKVIIADSLAVCANRVFDGVAGGATADCATAWVGALAYTLQLYFDFSGYSDMAIGLARLFNIRLPLNFNSPYQAASVIEFWQRWHITLSTFLRDYLYIPLGGNRKGPARRYLNLLLTMLLGGLWHGAGWTFVVWGALHGAYLILNHGWRALSGREAAVGWRRVPGVVLTFVAVVLGWVVFRADGLPAATGILRSMAGVPAAKITLALGADTPWKLLAVLLAVVWFLPNTQQCLGRFAPALLTRPADCAAPAWAGPMLWRPGVAWSLLASVAFAWAITLLARPSQFLYFQF